MKAFYEWDSQYFVSLGLQQELFEENEISNYIVWRFYGDYNNSQFDTYLLFGEKNGCANNFAVMGTNNWSKEQKIEFLKGIYLNKGKIK